jgi:hypothetical protein
VRRFLPFALLILATGLLFGAVAVAWLVLPFPEACRQTSCGPGFSSGAAPLLGHDNFTWPQTLTMLGGGLVYLVLVVVAIVVAVGRRGEGGDGEESPEPGKKEEVAGWRPPQSAPDL